MVFRNLESIGGETAMYKTAKRSWFIMIAMLGTVILLLPIATFAQNGDQGMKSGREETTNQTHAPLVTYTHASYLPLIMTPPFSIQSGDIKLLTSEGARAKGITVFTSTFTLDFSDLHFSHTPISMTISGDASWESNPAVYTTTYPITYVATLDDSTPGVKQINVTFIRKEAVVFKSFTFFYISNGDFHDNKLGGWIKTDGIVGIGEKQLTLGANVEPNGCNNHKEIGADGIRLMNIQLPSNHDYDLHINGLVYTRDQNPSNDDTYDAFEILVDGNVVDRYSNQESPISCTHEREINVNTRIPLNGYSGSITLSLENHLRFDGYFNTYTKIDTVWIE